MSSEPQSFVRSQKIENSRVGERNVLYHRDSGKAIVLNPTGSWLWEQLSTPQTAEALIAVLQQRFPEVSPEQALRDVEAFLDELKEHQAVTSEAAAADA